MSVHICVHWGEVGKAECCPEMVFCGSKGVVLSPESGLSSLCAKQQKPAELSQPPPIDLEFLVYRASSQTLNINNIFKMFCTGLCSIE